MSFKILFKIFLFLSFTNAFSQESPVVVELFTSQGCSSCPSADALLQEVKIAYGEDVIVLSYHADYWNYIGWRDPFSTKANTTRQYGIAKRFAARNVYTPQAVVNRNTHFTGSNRVKMNQAIKSESGKSLPLTVSIQSATRNNGEVIITTSVLDELDTDSVLTYAITVQKKVTAVQRGENRDRSLVNTHIVAVAKDIQASNCQTKMRLAVPEWVSVNDRLSAVVYVSSNTRGIISADEKSVN